MSSSPRALNMGWRRVEVEAGVGQGDSNGRVGAKDGFEEFRRPATEVSRPRVVGAELGLQTLPWNYCRFP